MKEKEKRKSKKIRRGMSTRQRNDVEEVACERRRKRKEGQGERKMETTGK